MKNVNVEDIIKILNDNKPGLDYKNETALLDDGLIDSLYLIKIIKKIENYYSLRFDVNRFEKSDFNSAKDIARLIQRFINDEVES